MRDKNNVWQNTMNATPLILGVIFGSIGLGYFMYGKKQKMTVPLACGLILMIYPYFIESTALLSAVGVILALLPYFLRF